MVAGSAVLWIGVPAACSWIAAQLTSDATAHLQITVPLTIAGMVLFAVLLFRVNRLYVRIQADAPDGLGSRDEEDDAERFLRGPLEPILVITLVLALIALTLWFFALAENPSQVVI